MDLVEKTASFLIIEDPDTSDEEDSDEENIGSSLLLLFSSTNQCILPQDRHRQKNYTGNVALHFRVDEFKTFFRVSRISVECLRGKISEICVEQNVSGILCRHSTGGSPQIPLEDRLLIFLWYMASMDKYAAIADRFGVSESTASYAIRNLITFIHDYLLNIIILWPTPQEQQEMKDMYMELKHFPGVVGMIDGTHISIKKPSIRGIDYYNRKDYYSIVLQAVVREDLRFTNIFAGFPGKVHDARVLRQSPLFQNGQALCGEGHLLGDSAYPNMSWLLTPFRDNGRLTNVQLHYNYTHSSIRSTVERAFGLLKGRFTRLQHINQNEVESIIHTIVTGCILHNICIMNDDNFREFLNDDQYLNNCQVQKILMRIYSTGDQ
ncbi:putative nuclease HARBI1 [Ostrea edulis]|uniref:putative nuclease HARBI1 n=1 Tax=Ostrea edulis TaxID=37623 RepID=UPI0024AEC1AB|nr:putative nuclease HARBI1 [Ostrea edulis]